MIIMTPTQTTFEKWALDLKRSVPTLIIPIPRDGVSKWWEWANTFIALNKLYSIPLSNRNAFPKEDDWKKWASFFIQNIQSVTLSQ